MTIQNFEALVNVPGVTYKRFCAFSCTNEATGEMLWGAPGEEMLIPMCEECVDKLEAHVQSLLDKQETSVLD
jgi:hypothetical protein